MERKLIFRLVGWHTNHQIIATHALRVHGTKAFAYQTRSVECGSAICSA